MQNYYNPYIPVHPYNFPNGGIPPNPPPITADTPVYSIYTGDLIGYGPIKKGTPNDAPYGNKNYGGVFHTVQYDRRDGAFMAHYAPNLPGGDLKSTLQRRRNS